MGNIKQTLESVGLNEREVKVYLAALELGESTVLPISRKAGIKRTYCYDILSDLQEKNLVTFFEKNNRRRYVAEDPKKLEALLKNRLKDFEAVLPELRSIYNKAPQKPKVKYFEGKEGIISLYEEAQKADELIAIGSISSIYQYLGDFFDQHIENIVKKKVRVRELIVHEETSPEYIKHYKKPFQEARFLPKGLNISTDMMLFANKLAMISYEGDLHAVVIESSSIINTQKTLFEIIWSQAERIY